MRRATKKRIMAITIVLTFGLSSIAFIIVSFTGTTTVKEIKQLTNFVVAGELDPDTEYEYYIRGFTIMKFYYADPQHIGPYIGYLPDRFRTTNRQIQLIIETIQSNDTYINIININADETIYDTSEEEIRTILCNTLISVPIECVIMNMSITGAEITGNVTDNISSINNTNNSTNNNTGYNNTVNNTNA